MANLIPLHLTLNFFLLESIQSSAFAVLPILFFSLFKEGFFFIFFLFLFLIPEKSVSDILTHAVKVRVSRQGQKAGPGRSQWSCS